MKYQARSLSAIIFPLLAASAIPMLVHGATTINVDMDSGTTHTYSGTAAPSAR